MSRYKIGRLIGEGGMVAVIGATLSSPDPRALRMFRGQTLTVVDEFLEIEEREPAPATRKTTAGQ